MKDTATAAGATTTEAQGEPLSVGFLLVPGFALMSYAAAVEPLRAANLLSGRTLYR
jgi:transcriptional regulator GlxA family with amidase domain